MPLRSECRLRTIKEDDLSLVLSWRNSDRIRAGMYTDHIITPIEHQEWFARLGSDGGSRCLIFEYQGKKLGVVNITRVDRKNGTCHWGFYIGDPGAPRGIGRAMGFLGLEFLFEEMEIRKVYGESFSFNEASIRFHRDLGFIREGIFRKHTLKNGRYEDVDSMALFREDWERCKDELENKCFGER